MAPREQQNGMGPRVAIAAPMQDMGPRVSPTAAMLDPRMEMHLRKTIPKPNPTPTPHSRRVAPR